jgi:cytoskeletal protein CcmA (bactofilin family)
MSIALIVVLIIVMFMLIGGGMAIGFSKEKFSISKVKEQFALLTMGDNGDLTVNKTSFKGDADSTAITIDQKLIAGDIDVKGNIDAADNMKVSGFTTLNTLTTGNTTVNGTLTTDGNTTVRGNLTTNGNTRVNGTIYTVGNTTSGGKLTGSKGLCIGGNCITSFTPTTWKFTIYTLKTDSAADYTIDETISANRVQVWHDGKWKTPLSVITPPNLSGGTVKCDDVRYFGGADRACSYQKDIIIKNSNTITFDRSRDMSDMGDLIINVTPRSDRRGLVWVME